MAQEEIILASGSPRRRELLDAMGIRFEVVTADVAEHDAESAPHLAPIELACENARQKAEAVARLKPARWVLGADTVVALDQAIFGKPDSIGQAHDFLRALSGKTHEVITGCALAWLSIPTGPMVTSGGEIEIFHATTRVTFRPLTDEIIARYLAAVNVLDKAGAYALQEHGDWIIDRVEGSRNNVIGLPTESLERVFRRRGLL